MPDNALAQEIVMRFPVFIFGAGRGGSLVRQGLAAIGVGKVAAYIDNFKTGSLDGHEIISYAAFRERAAEDRLVVVASQSFAAITETLEGDGVDNAVNAYPFIERVIAAEKSGIPLERAVETEALSVLLPLMRLHGEIAAGLPAGRKDPDTWRRILHEKMLLAENPAPINEILNHYEYKHGFDDLLSFPVMAALNMSSVCNARCTFCSYHPPTQRFKDQVSLDDVRKMTWLKYVSTFAVWGGVGDSLVASAFLPIVRWLKENHPHLKLTLSTNGQNLSREICEVLVDSIYDFNVSLNAASDATRVQLMKSPHFDHICEMYRYLADLKAQRKQAFPMLGLSMVVTRSNMDEVVAFADLAKSIGAERVTYVHYVSTTLVGKRLMDADDSCYNERERFDALMAVALERCRELGLTVSAPVPFAQSDVSIRYGYRSADGGGDPSCQDPWRTCYLTVDEDGRRQMIFCCSGFYYEIPYDKSELGEEDFRRIWNNPVARFFRRTTNTPGRNPICEFCQTVDKFDPQCSTKIYSIHDRIQPALEAIQRKTNDGTLSDAEVDELLLGL